MLPSPRKAARRGFYDAIAAGYDGLHKEEQERKYAIILLNLELGAADRVLDVGCGTGLFFTHLPPRSLGIDPSKGLLAQVPAKYGKRVKLAGAEAIPYPDHRFDVVVSVTALQNMEDPKKAIEEMKRVGNDRFAITFLKRSPGRRALERLLRREFPKAKVIEEEKDILFLVNPCAHNKI